MFLRNSVSGWPGRSSKCWIFWVLRNSKGFLPVLKLDSLEAGDSGHIVAQPGEVFTELQLKNFINVTARESICFNPVSLCFVKFRVVVASALWINIPFPS